MKKLIALLLLSPLAFSADKYQTVWVMEGYSCPSDNLRIERKKFFYADKFVQYNGCSFQTFNQSKNIQKKFPQEVSDLTTCNTKVVVRELENNKVDVKTRNGLFLISIKQIKENKNTPIDYFIRVGEDKLDAESNVYQCIGIERL